MKKMRAIRIEGDLAFVTLTRGYTAVIDASDVERVSVGNWHAVVQPKTVYAMRNDHTSGTRKGIYLHRLLMDAPDDVQVDHANCDGLDNRRANLRLATPSQNSQNNRRQCNNKSGAKGVSWSAKRRKWIAAIQLGGRINYLGGFVEIEDAKAAYAKACAELHGEFARVE